MPLFMDRHDVPGASAADVAAAHASDVKLAAEYGVQFFSYWFDEAKGGVFCFAKAPARENLMTVHRESHGLVPSEIISVDESDVLRFLGKVHDPVDESEVTSPFRTILFTDLVDSTAMMEEMGPADFMAVLQEHDLIVRRALVAALGREIKHTGDGMLVVFDSIDAALRAGLEMRDGFEGWNAEHSGSPLLQVRLGMAAGEPVDHNDDIYGSAVNLAARLCGAAGPGHILVSDVIRERAEGSSFTFDRGRDLELKGFRRPVTCFELLGVA